MSRQNPKLRTEETWAKIRRGWERGETGASLAQRYDVGLANLWRRRASEGWERGGAPDPTPEPVEGWDRYAERRLEAFLKGLGETRALALAIVAAVRGGASRDVPLWHLGFLFACRAEHLGEAAAEEDRERAKGQPWAGAIWDAEGRMRPAHVIDREMLRLYRDAWRKQEGVPEGAAEDWP